MWALRVLTGTERVGVSRWIASWKLGWITDVARYNKFGRPLVRALGVTLAVLCAVVPLLFLLLWGVTVRVAGG